MERFIIYLLCLPAVVTAVDWPQAAGAGNFRTADNAPTEWSVALGKNISWKITLPETGQSTPVISKGKVFFSTLKPVKADSTLGKDIVAWCCDAASGKILWKREIEGKYLLRLSGCFSDSSAPPAVVDGDRVVFLNASGRITCYNLNGKVLWSRPFLSVGRTLPFSHAGQYVFTRQIYPPDPNGVFPKKYAQSPREMWTQLQALDMKSGEVVWTTECGVNMGMSTLPQVRSDGRGVAVVGRGGGHGPPEKPFGISMVDLANGETLWTLPLDGFMATMSYRLHKGAVHIFHYGDHLSVDEVTGKIIKRVSFIKNLPVATLRNPKITGKESLKLGKNKRMITQGSNLLVGKYHYFRSYVRPWLGRVNVESGAVECLELPLQLSRSPQIKDQLIWYKKALIPNEMKNSRGFKVVGDKRSHGSGWGHVSSPIPTVAGEYLYVPVMNGTVYVVEWNADKLNASAVKAINDLGAAGQSWMRSSFSFSNKRAYTHTIGELICIGK